MALLQLIENIDEETRQQAGRLHRQLQDAKGNSVTLRLEARMIDIFRDVTGLMEKVAGFAVAALADELTPEQAGKILGVSRPLVVRRMDDGRLPFRYEGTHRRCKLEDVLQLKETEDRQTEELRALAKMGNVDFQPTSRRSPPDNSIDHLVLGTTNAPYRRLISAGDLAACLASGDTSSWKYMWRPSSRTCGQNSF